MPEMMDPECPLTERGKKAAARMGLFLKRAGVEVQAVWHSTKKRAMQTAQAITEALGVAGLCRECEGLKPNDPVEGIAEKIREFSAGGNNPKLMIVAHLPLLQKLTGLLVAGTPEIALLDFEEVTVACLEGRPEGRYCLRWVVEPALIPAP